MIIDDADLDFALDVPAKKPRGFSMRPYQNECVRAVDDAFDQGFLRVLVAMATGTGKGSLAAYWAKRTREKKKKMLFLAHRETLVRQTAQRIEKQGGVECEIEMGQEFATLTASCVCASIQTLTHDRRLLGFPHDHFDLVIFDECHHLLSASFIKVAKYFHFGPDALLPGWVGPQMGIPYAGFAKVIGLTATPELGERSLGEFFQHTAYEYDLLRAVKDGYLVPPVSMSVPVKVDLTGIKKRGTTHGADISDKDLFERLSPALEALAMQLKELASDRKTVAFVPSIECAKMLARFVSATGLRGMYVSGVCIDVDEKLDEFRAAGAGTVICNASLISEGVDIPDIDCAAMFRGTGSLTYYKQGCGRAARPLEGLVDGIPTAEGRRLAIASSKKPNFLILDPLWISDKFDLIQPYQMVTNDQRLLKKMASIGSGDLVSAHESAERDLLASLESQVIKASKKKGRTMDPLAYALSVGDDAMRNYKPETKWDAMPARPGRLRLIKDLGLDTSKITCDGLAAKMIQKLIARRKNGLCTPKQLGILLDAGLQDHKVALLSEREAQRMIDELNARRETWELSA